MSSVQINKSQSRSFILTLIFCLFTIKFVVCEETELRGPPIVSEETDLGGPYIVCEETHPRGPHMVSKEIDPREPPYSKRINYSEGGPI